MKNGHTQTGLLGCLFLGFFLLVLGLGSSVLILRQERDLARYPNAVEMSSHSKYKIWPAQLRWDDTYASHHVFPEVYKWYTQRFGIKTETLANGNCVNLEGRRILLGLKQDTIVSICDTAKGRMIYVTRLISFE